MELSPEDLMRGLVARAFALAQVIVTDALFTLTALLLNVFAIWLVADVQTREAFIFAPFLVAASLVLAGKGAVLLHRKWNEYERMEKERLGRSDILEPNILPNPMLEVAKLSRKLMAICDVTAILLIAPVTLWLSLSALASNFPTDHLPVMVLSLVGCSVGVTYWVLAPASNKDASQT